MSEPVKLCKDCRHARKFLASVEFDSLALCAAAPPERETCVVTGASRERHRGCEWTRGPLGPCGPDGLLFELRS